MLIIMINFWVYIINIIHFLILGLNFLAKTTKCPFKCKRGGCFLRVCILSNETKKKIEIRDWTLLYISSSVKSSVSFLKVAIFKDILLQVFLVAIYRGRSFFIRMKRSEL